MARHFAGLAWLALLGATVPSITLADDPPSQLLQDTATRAKLAKDALKSTVDSAISKSGKLPADAGIIVLQSAENEVNEANFLTPDEKKAYLATLSAKKKSLETGGSTPPTKPSGNTGSQTEMQTSERIKEEMNIIRALEKAGESAKAKSRLKALLDKYPNNPSLLAYASVSSRQDSVKDQAKANSDRGNSEQAAFGDIVKSGNVPPNGAMSYDKKTWDKASKREPVGSVVNNLTKREKDYLRILDQLSSSDFNLNETSFDQVVKMLEKELGFTLIISKATMEEVRITYESKLTYQIPRNVSKRTLLRSVLAEMGLTYIIKGELVQIVSFIQAKSEMRVGILDVGTMVRNGNNINDLVKMIKSIVEPDSWDTSGGGGTITVQPPGTLIIKNSAEVIYQLGSKPK